jgi:hypothetical protein
MHGVSYLIAGRYRKGLPNRVDYVARSAGDVLPGETKDPPARKLSEVVPVSVGLE